MNESNLLEKVGFGGGCHWCTEAVFQALAGVHQVEQGFIKSLSPHDSFSEAVIVHFNPQIIPIKVLCEIHLRTHASSSSHVLRGKYRSAIYSFSDAQQIQVTGILEELSSQFIDPLVTQTLPFETFKSSDPRFQNYRATDPERPFCKTYIDPKLQLLRQEFSGRLK